MPIQVLPQTLINQIAAGEVVVGMASVVKELVENSIDAGARNLSVELSSDVRDVTVSDDGCGMDREDAELCLQRHATSKIRHSEDLFHLVTRGFRGEAIPSIAAVSRLELQTRSADQLAGTRVVVEGGAIERIESVGCPAGTRIAVRDLFYNTPARRKFIKSTLSETNAIFRILVRQALAVPAAGFRFVKEGRAMLDVPAGQELAMRFCELAGGRIEHGLLALDGERGGVRLRGCLAQPLSSRGDRRSQYLFVNGRPFTSRSVASAIEQSCRGFIMVGRFPVFCAFIELPPGDVDINVHPTKEEVRFRDERAVCGACYHAARAALEAHGLVPELRLGDAPRESAPPSPGVQAAGPSSPAIPLAPAIFTSPEALVARAFERKRARELQTDLVGYSFGASPPRASGRQEPEESGGVFLSPEPDPSRQRSITQHGGARPDAGPGERPDDVFWQRPIEAEPLGQVAETYIAARFGEDLILVDQHAAHERIRFMELKARAASVASQALLVPQTIEVPPDRVAVLEAVRPALLALGFEVEEFGGRTYTISAVPADLTRLDAAALLQDVLDEFEDEPRTNRIEDARDRILIRAACHSAIRAGQRLNIEEMRELLRLMRVNRLSFTCPHGRPTIIRLSKAELDRQFKRIP